MRSAWFFNTFLHLQVLFIVPSTFPLPLRYRPITLNIFTAMYCQLVSISRKMYVDQIIVTWLSAKSLCLIIVSRDWRWASGDTFLIMVQPHGFWLGMDIELGQFRFLAIALAMAGVLSVNYMGWRMGISLSWQLSVSGFSMPSYLMKMIVRWFSTGLALICSAESSIFLHVITYLYIYCIHVLSSCFSSPISLINVPPFPSTQTKTYAQNTHTHTLLHMHGQTNYSFL